MDPVDNFFATDGLLSEKLLSYSPRPEQVILAKKIAEVILNRDILVAEAGTGTGKTFAYLVPALLARQKTIISTGTKNLQDQLYYRDLPFVRDLLILPVKVALLKGRSNYLCKYRIEQFWQSSDLLDEELNKQVIEVRSKMAQTTLGETSEINTIAEGARVWPYVTSTVDNCLSQECPFYNDCYLVKARRKAMDADVVIINHYLFFADLALKKEGFSELLPTVETFILDEAHQLPETASQFFGVRISSRQLALLIQDIENEWQETAQDTTSLADSLQRVKHALQQFRSALGDKGKKQPWITVAKSKTVLLAQKQISDELDFLVSLLEQAGDNSKGLQLCWQRCVDYKNTFSIITKAEKKEFIYWFETTLKGFTVHATPLQITEQFQALLKRENASWVFTSATLSVANNMQHYLVKLGLEQAKTLQLTSPFDYAKQALLYIPRYLPDPNEESYTQSVIAISLPVINAARGRTFILFTSYSAMQEAEEILREKLQFPLLVQGSLPKTQLLQKYRELGDAVLLATNSFWEGVDVRGDALSCVIIDKLPFSNPHEPVLSARLAALRRQGKDPFTHYQLPHAAIGLKQGAGRLIRDIADKGVLVICDPRLMARHYSQVFLQSLPAMRRTRELTHVIDFFTAVKEIVE